MTSSVARSSTPNERMFASTIFAEGTCFSINVALTAPRLSASSPKCPSAGEQVDRVTAGTFGADQVEKRFARAMLHGPHERIAMILQPPTAKRAANDVHFGVASVGAGRPALLRIFFAFMCHW